MADTFGTEWIADTRPIQMHELLAGLQRARDRLAYCKRELSRHLTTAVPRTLAKLENDVAKSQRDFDHALSAVENEHARRESNFGGID